MGVGMGVGGGGVSELADGNGLKGRGFKMKRVYAYALLLICFY